MFEPLLPLRHDFGEGPVWSVAEQALWWVDIPGRRLFRLRWSDRGLQSWLMPSEPGSMAPASDGSVVVALRNGFHRFEPDSGRLTLIAAPSYDTRTVRLNDGRCDPRGRFWAGTMDTTRTGPNGRLWGLDAGRLIGGFGEVYVSNGLAFSPDGRWMYHADSQTRTIRRYAYDPATGGVGQGDVWCVTPAELGDPDGASVDAAGRYWIAMAGGGCLLCLGEDGREVARVETPLRWATMVTFAGPALDEVIVTSGRRNRPAEELAAYPHSGAVLVGRIPGVIGLPEAPYRIS